MARKLILGEQDIARILDRLASEVIDRHGDCKDLDLVGIERRGADLARRLLGLIQEKTGHDIGLGTLDINLYRDDWTSMEASPHVGTSHMRTPITGATVLLIDDVLYTGRTIRSALEAMQDYGRPNRVELLVLIDRGHRELPIQADYIGRKIETTNREHIDVLLKERDGSDEVDLIYA